MPWNQAPLDAARVTETEPHHFCSDASDLGIRAADPIPTHIPTTIGNGQPFLLEFDRTERRDGDVLCWHYRQQLGCCELTLFND